MRNEDIKVLEMFGTLGSQLKLSKPCYGDGLALGRRIFHGVYNIRRKQEPP